MKTIIRTFGVTLLALVFIASGAFANALADGRAAEKAGKIREAVRHYTQALQSTREGSDAERKLQERIITLARKLKPPPTVPEEAHRYLARGEAFAEAATDKDGFQKAAIEFQAAAKVAPWLADVYYNLGLVQDKAGLYNQAMQSLELYLLAAPNASDARKVRNLIYKIEARSEASRSMARKAEEERKKKKGIEELAGIWRFLGNEGHDEAFHLRAEVTGNGLLWVTVFDKDFPPETRAWRAGDEKPKYRIWQKGHNIVGSTIDYDSSLSTQEIGVTVSKNYKKITFAEWYKFMKPPKRTFVYYKCRNTSLGSCGW